MVYKWYISCQLGIICHLTKDNHWVNLYFLLFLREGACQSITPPKFNSKFATAQRPVPPPKQAASSTSTVADHHMEPAPEEPADVHMAPVDSTEISFTEMLKANDAAMAPAPW